MANTPTVTPPPAPAPAPAAAAKPPAETSVRDNPNFKNGRETTQKLVGAATDAGKTALDKGTDGMNWFSRQLKEIEDKGIGEWFGGVMNGIGDKTKGIQWPQLLMGLVTVGGAWLVSNIFGDGWMSTVIFGLLAIPAFFMGRDLGNSLFGPGKEPDGREPPQRQRALDAAGQAHQREREQQTDVATTVLQPRADRAEFERNAAPVPPTVLQPRVPGASAPAAPPVHMAVDPFSNIGSATPDMGIQYAILDQIERTAATHNIRMAAANIPNGSGVLPSLPKNLTVDKPAQSR